MKDKHRNDRSWYDWIYSPNFTDAFIDLFWELGWRIASVELARWQNTQVNMDTFEAEVHLMGLELEETQNAEIYS